MPVYAVAIGRRIGIYNTYAECLEQVKNYPNAKFKKFESSDDAIKFIEQFSNKSSQMCPAKSFIPEKEGMLQTFPIEKVSPSNTVVNALNKRVVTLEEKLNKFILSTNEMIESLKNKIRILEKRPLEQDTEEPGPSLKTKKVQLDSEEGDKTFTKDSRGFIIVYTDGACTNNGRDGAKAGIGVWFGHNNPLNVSAPVEGSPTNNNAEIQAACVAIRQARDAGISKLSVSTDSKFLINCITQWIHKWKKNNWQLSTGGPVKNKDRLVELDNAIQKMEAVEWNYVAGHAGIIGNEKADQLARLGAQRYKQNSSSVILPDDDD
ncbi:hypothetical protein AAG570_001436 [Ranatra chinensis]|uniref:Ribonuclease H1 n=1 Tax=Ranatra chinensis TaxID=642074 RepID=A0ABD0YBV7_9HEMI